jgi:SAM-dependent methyltransferase
VTPGVAADWWATFFEGPALELWRRAHTRDENRGQAADLVRVLELTRGERVLDVPCGNGRLALELTGLGARVSGLDSAPEFVSEARRRAAERLLELDLRQGDMRALPWQDEFDAAFCAGNSFGYFDDEGNGDFLRSVARALRPGGRFLLEYPLVAELALARREYRDWRILGERILLSDARYDEHHGRLETSYTFVDLARAGGALERRSASYRIYTARALVELLRAAGFTAVELLGSLEGQRFEPGTSEFFALARRA